MEEIFKLDTTMTCKRYLTIINSMDKLEIIIDYQTLGKTLLNLINVTIGLEE